MTTQYRTEYLLPDSQAMALEMCAIPSGTFIMGSPNTEKGRYGDIESPQHKVNIQSFYIGKYPITQAQWRVIASCLDLKVERDLNPEPSYFEGDNRPVENVSWDDAVEFCTRLSKLTGRNYRLPSEAEWEYACRAETTTPFYFGGTITTDLVNYNGNYTYADAQKGQYRHQTTPVGQFPSNAFGLHDMHGNVWEWCADSWHYSYINAPDDGSAWLSDKTNYRTLRGGSWVDVPAYCRSAIRVRLPRDHRHANYGFRVVCRQDMTVEIVA